MPQGPFLRIAEVAAMGNVQARAISEYLTQSRDEVGQGAKRHRGKYADDPFPAPDFRIGKAACWLPEREAEIRAWFERHPRTRKGVGYGGRPRKSAG